MDLKNKNLWNYSLPILIGLIVISNYYQRLTDPKKARKAQFKGVVKKIYYDAKKNPHILVNGKEYDFEWMIWDKYFIIHKGDTIIKTKGDIRIKLIKPNTRDTIVFNDNG